MILYGDSCFHRTSAALLTYCRAKMYNWESAKGSITELTRKNGHINIDSVEKINKKTISN